MSEATIAPIAGVTAGAPTSSRQGSRQGTESYWRRARGHLLRQQIADLAKTLGRDIAILDIGGRVTTGATLSAWITSREFIC